MVKKQVKKQIRRLKNLDRWFTIKWVLIKISVLIAIHLVLANVIRFFPKNYPIRIFLDILSLVISVYFIILVVKFVRLWLKTLFNTKNIFILVIAYGLFLAGILFTISSGFNAIESFKLGYLKYGSCHDKFSADMISSDPLISHEYFYYTSITFFTVGLGDICPMGWAKVLTIITAFIGHTIAVILVAIILNNYLRNKESV